MIHSKRRSLVALTGAVVAASSAHAEIIVSAGNHSVAPGGSVEIAVMVQVTGDSTFSDMLAQIQIGADASDPLNPTAPQITALSFADTVWPAGGFGNITDVSELPDQYLSPSASLATAGATIGSGSGVLLRITVDAASWPQGDYPILLSDTFGGATSFESLGSPVVPTLNSGTLTIVPEPSMALALLAGGALLRRRVHVRTL